MVALHAGNDLLLVRTAERIVVIAHELHLSVVRVRARGAEEHAPIAHRHHGLELLGELDRRLVALAAEHVAVGQLLHLRGGDVRERFLAIAERRAPEPGHALDVLLAVHVPDAHAFRTIDDQRSGLLVKCEIRRRVQQRGEVPRSEAVGGEGVVKALGHGGGPDCMGRTAMMHGAAARVSARRSGREDARRTRC